MPNILVNRIIYDACKITGRSPFCPRRGVYKILSTHRGFCLGKPALMAMTNWKLEPKDIYPNLVFEIQLESFRSNPDIQRQILIPEKLVGREIQIREADYYPSIPKFVINWILLPKKEDSTSADIQKAFRDNINQIDLKSFDDLEIPEDDFGDDFDFEGGY